MYGHTQTMERSGFRNSLSHDRKQVTAGTMIRREQTRHSTSCGPNLAFHSGLDRVAIRQVLMLP